MPTQTERINAALAGRYRIERHLGEGGMAAVYLAFDEKHDRRVALKLLKPELAAVLGAERFVQEIKTTAALQHPHILPLFDSGTADGFLFYVMPYIEGETLRDKLNRETQLSINESVQISREVADALDYAHRHGVIHRDIKPENILLNDGRATVADFGIALAVSAAAGGRMTETGLSLGTPHYMSPEQATAEKEITARSDVYSLASVLYEMLTGNPPHTGASAQQIIMKIITAPTEPVTKHRKSVPEHIADALATALEKLPADRFESAKAFSLALANPGYTSATSSGLGLGQRRGARRALAPSVAVAWSIAAVAILAGIWGWTRPEAARDVSRFGLLLPDSQKIGVGNFARLAVAPDGRKIAYVGEGTSASTTRIWVRSFDQLRATPVPGTENAGNPSFSPDGRRLAFTSANPRAIKTIALAGGPAITVADSLVDLGGVAWGTDGYIYYDGHMAGDGMSRVRENGGPPESATMPDTAAGELYHNMPSALPNGRGVLFTVARAGGLSVADVAVLDSKTGKHRVLVRGIGGRYVASGHIIYVTDEGTLMGATFDLGRLTITGEAVPVTEGLALRGSQRVDVGVSSNGLLAYIEGFRRSAESEFAWVNRDGTASAVDPQFTSPLGKGALSPDGKRLSVGRGPRPADAQLWVKQLDRGPASKIADRGTAPVWSADGQTLMFIGPDGLTTVPSDGSRLPTILRPTSYTLGRVTSFDWSRDGQWVVFSARANMYAFQISGDTSPRSLLVSSAIESSPQLSPDGRWLAYTSDDTGSPVLYVRPFPNVEVAKHQISTGAATFPQWSRDGRELFYIDDRSNIIAVPIAPGTSFTVGTQKTLFNTAQFSMGWRPFDLSPDGKRFLMPRALGIGSDRTDEVILVQNFFDELRAKVPSKR